MTEVHYILKSLDDTDKITQKLATYIQLPATIALTGDLGSGKTTFTQLLAKHMGGKDHMPSPSFTLVNEYHLRDQKIIHADLYRLDHHEEIEQLGLSDYFSKPDTLTIIEWADRHPQFIPDSALWVTLMIVDDSHRVMDIATKDELFWHRFGKDLT